MTRNVRHLMEGHLWLRSRYFQMMDVETSQPRSARALWIMGVPQKGLSREIWRMRRLITGSEENMLKSAGWSRYSIADGVFDRDSQPLTL